MSYLGRKIWMGWALALAVAGIHCKDRDVWRVPGQLLGAPDSGVTSAAERCVPGQTFPCMGACGAPLSGYQVCAVDGLSYGACICPQEGLPEPRVPTVDREFGGRVNLPALGSGSLPPTTPSGSSGPVVGEGVVGAECRNASDCITGLDCFSANTNSLGVGGPAGGYCSKPCGSASACTSLDPGSDCQTIAGQQICVRMCASKAAPEGQSKCLSRADLTCVSVAALGQEDATDEPQLGMCVPRCQSDAACDGRRCDLRTGLCSDTPRVGAPISGGCSVPEDCAGGVCLPLNDQVTPFCTAFCTRGVSGCGFDGSEPSIGATCFFQQIQGEGPGDRGLCIAQCDVDADCAVPGSVCVPQESAEGRAGVCLHPLVPLVPPAGGPSPGVPDAITTGNACATAADCGTGLICLTPEFDLFGLGGGPPGGYCSAPCGDQDCPEPGSQCRGPQRASAVCLRGCTVGEPNPCAGRDTLTCTVLPDETEGFCQPQCNSDADCGERLCAPSGLCVEAPPVPAPGCDEDAECGAGRICQTALGTCVEAPPPVTPDCIEDADCDGEQLCRVQEGECVDPPVPCVDDTGCDAAQVCDTALGECVAPTLDCESDAECGAQVCNPVTGECIDAPAIPVGGACTADAECSEDLCLPTDGSRFCSGTCLVGTSAGCESYGSEAFCAGGASGTDGLCVELCRSEADCAQADYECVALSASIDACLPPLPCTLDSDCTDGQVCDLAAAACVPEPPIPVGGACVTDDECVGGICLSFGATDACSGACDAATQFGCESYGTDALCLPLDDTNTVGACIELCNVASDCEQSSHVCEPINTTFNDRTGICLPPAPAAAPPAP